MTLPKLRSILIPFFTVCLILGVSTGIIAYGRGYRMDLQKPTNLKPTGLLSATSDPIAAQVLLDGLIKTATNNSLPIEPGWYTVQIRKEGYIPWEKKLRVQGEVVTRADAYLIPTNPSLSPITTPGILTPTLSPEGNTVAFFVTAEAVRNGIKKPGLWTLELADRPLGGRNRDPKLVVELPGSFPYKEATILWSPDGRSMLLRAGTTATVYEASGNASSSAVTPLTKIALTNLLTDWQKEKEEKDRQKLAAYKQPFIDVATTSARLLAFSPDETKLLYQATAAATIPLIIDPPLIGTNPTEEARAITPGKLYVYDSKEDKNFFLLEKKELPQKTKSNTIGLLDNWIIGNSGQPGWPVWFPTSRHLLITLPGKIDIMEYDRTNWTTLYSGPFDGSFVTPWPTGSRIVILTNLNPGAGSLPNLYTVNLR